jgi:4-amino-4-deoxy-L-arabinose transferase-like glycosyltransferase
MDQANPKSVSAIRPEAGPSTYRKGRLSTPLVHLAFIFLCGMFIYCLWLGASPLYRTEPFRALVAHQMVHGSSWLIPHLYGELYQRKPPLIYWIEGGSELLAGRWIETLGYEFVWRLPSALGSALLAVFLAHWAGRWFGDSARMPTGFACLALVAMWDQDRGADIDALNTVFAMLATVCVLELLCGTRRGTAGWTLGLGISLGAALLLKGPGTLPQVIGAIIGPAIAFGNWKFLRRVSVWIGILIGFAIFTSYIVAAKIAMHRAGIVADKTGWYEIIEKIFLHGWLSRLKALGLPFQLLIFSLPVSVVLPFAVMLIRRLPVDNSSRQRAIAILATLIATLLIWLIDGNDNPRYEYVMLPLLAPLVGFVWMMHERMSAAFSRTLLGVCVLLCGADALVTLKLPAGIPEHLSVWVGMGLSVLVLIAVIARSLAAKAARQGGNGVVVLLLLFALPMAARKNTERRKKSAANASMALRYAIGSAKRVSAAGVVRDLPELFYYANVDVDSYGEFGLPKLAATARGHWVVISENEKYPAYSTITKYIPGAFPRGVTRLPMPTPTDVIYVGWYDPPVDADTRIEWHVDKPGVEPDE